MIDPVEAQINLGLSMFFGAPQDSVKRKSSPVKLTVKPLPPFSREAAPLELSGSPELAAEAFLGLPDAFRELCGEVVITVADFPTQDVQKHMDAGPFDLLGLFQGVGLAVSSNLSKRIADDLIKSGAVKRPALGIAARDLDDAAAKRAGARNTNGAVVTKVQEDSAAAKAGMHGFTKALAQEVVKKGVTVNAISPGYVQTDMTNAIREGVRQQIVAQIPAGRMGLPEEIADSVAFLASDKASYITGTNLSVNGGLHMYA